MPSIRKHQPSPKAPITKPADGRADQTRSICHRGVDGDGVTEVVTIIDHLYEEGLPSRHIEGINYALHNGESDNFPEVDDVCQREHGLRPGIERKLQPVSTPAVCGD